MTSLACVDIALASVTLLTISCCLHQAMRNPGCGWTAHKPEAYVRTAFSIKFQVDFSSLILCKWKKQLAWECAVPIRIAFKCEDEMYILHSNSFFDIWMLCRSRGQIWIQVKLALGYFRACPKTSRMVEILHLLCWKPCQQIQRSKYRPAIWVRTGVSDTKRKGIVLWMSLLYDLWWKTVASNWDSIDAVLHPWQNKSKVPQ